MDLTLSSSYYDNYDPKKKSPARTRAARTRLAAALGVLVVVGVLVLMWGRGAREAAPAAPSAAGTSGRQVQGAAASPSPPAAATPAARLTLSDRMVSVAPMYRGPGKIETFPGFANANRVLLATHNRLMWYRYDTDELRVIHEGQVRTPGLAGRRPSCCAAQLAAAGVVVLCCSVPTAKPWLLTACC